MVSNGQLRICQILVFLVSATAGLVISIAISWTSRILRGDCVLFSKMSISKTSNGSIVVSFEKSEWGSEFQCEFSTFCPVGLTIYCIIWMWFYIFLSDWGTTFIESREEREQREPDRPPPDQHLLIPSIGCNLVVFGLLLATVAMIAAGRSVWCEHNIEVLKEKECSYVGDFVWLNLKGGQDIYRYLKHAVVGCWVLLISMVIQTVIMFVRLRRNSQQSSLQSHLLEESSIDSDDDLLSDAELPDPESSESDCSSIQEVIATARRRKLNYKQNHVVIAEFSQNGADNADQGARLLDNVLMCETIT